MGMFDTFLVKDKVECQTKELDCCLNYYSLGDTVPSYGSMVNYYIIAGHGDDKHGIIVIDNIYLAYCEPDKVQSVFETFTSMPGLAHQTLSSIVKNTLNVKLDNAISKLYKISSALREYEKFKSDPDENSVFRLLRGQYFDRLEQGDDIIDIINEILKKDVEE